MYEDCLVGAFLKWAEGVQSDAPHMAVIPRLIQSQLLMTASHQAQEGQGVSPTPS